MWWGQSQSAVACLESVSARRGMWFAKVMPIAVMSRCAGRTQGGACTAKPARLQLQECKLPSCLGLWVAGVLDLLLESRCAVVGTDCAVMVLCTHACGLLIYCLPVLQLELRLSEVRKTSDLNKAVLRGEVADPDWVLQDMQRLVEVGIEHCWGCHCWEVQRVPSQRTALQGYCSPSDLWSSFQHWPLTVHRGKQASICFCLPRPSVSSVGLCCRSCKTLPSTTA